MATYKKLIDLFNGVAQGLDVTVKYQTARNQAVNIKDNQKESSVFLISATRNTNISIDQNTFTKLYQCVLRFMQRDELDSPEDKKNLIISAQEKISDKFLYALAENEQVFGITGISTSFFYNAYDSNMTGVQVTFTIELDQKEDWC